MESLGWVAGPECRGRSQMLKATYTAKPSWPFQPSNSPTKCVRIKQSNLPKFAGTLPRAHPISLGHDLTVYQVWNPIGHVAFCREEISIYGKVTAVTPRPSVAMWITSLPPPHLPSPVFALKNSMNLPSWTICPPLILTNHCSDVQELLIRGSHWRPMRSSFDLEPWVNVQGEHGT